MEAAAQLQRQGERLRILHEIDRAILGARSPREIAEAAAEGILRETPETLAARMDSLLGKFEGRGIPRETVVRSAVLTPACGLGTLGEEEAEGAARLAGDLSRLLRRRYGGAAK